MNEWTDCKIEMPQDGVEVLALYKINNVMAVVAFIGLQGWNRWERKADDYSWPKGAFTHWMKLPKPPARESDHG